jgi:hypothetical protein
MKGRRVEAIVAQYPIQHKCHCLPFSPLAPAQASPEEAGPILLAM